MRIHLSNLRLFTAATMLAVSPLVSHAQLTTDQLGALHNEILGKYFSGGNAAISPSNYKQQVPIAVQFVCQELNTKGLHGKGCDNQSYGISLATQMVTERYGSSATAMFDNKIAVINAKFPLTSGQQAMISDLRNILCTPGPLSMKQNMLASLRTQFLSSSPTGTFKEWFGGELSIAEGSCTFWSSPGNPSGGNDPQGFLIGDCLGFLIGWTDQAIDDAGSPGGLTPAGENNRLVHAAWGAVVGSVVGP